MNNLLKKSYLGIIIALLYLPILIVVVFSFNNARYSLLWRGFSTRWYHILWHDATIWLVTWHSILIGIIAATTASLLGTLAAVCLIRYRFFGRAILHGTIFILIIVPNIVLGISLLLLYNISKIPLGFWSLLLAHITFCIPFVTILVYSRMKFLDKNIFEAAQDLGASEYIIFKRIIVPLMWPAIIAGWLLNFAMSIDDVTVSYFVSGPTYNILPLQIYSMVRMGVSPEITALSSILFGATLVIVVAAYFALNKISHVGYQKTK